jgi:hypothetical protein
LHIKNIYVILENICVTCKKEMLCYQEGKTARTFGFFTGASMRVQEGKTKGGEGKRQYGRHHAAGRRRGGGKLVSKFVSWPFQKQSLPGG